MSKHHENNKDSNKLEKNLIEAHYLGLELRLAANHPDFRYAAATGFVADLLIGWARFMGARRLEGERLFEDEHASQAEPRRNDRRRAAR